MSRTLVLDPPGGGRDYGKLGSVTGRSQRGDLIMDGALGHTGVGTWQGQISKQA